MTFVYDALQSMGTCIKLFTSISPNFFGDLKKSKNCDTTILTINGALRAALHRHLTGFCWLELC